MSQRLIKKKFKKELTSITNDGKEVFCPFHGKIRHRFFRVHFSWPIRHKEPVAIHLRRDNYHTR
jgi:hypothetical protein